MDKIRLAFLGCGDVAQRDYLPELHRGIEHLLDCLQGWSSLC